jgi:ribonuclease HI
MKKIISLVSIIAFGGFIAGCASTGYEKAGTTSNTLRQAAQSIDNARAPIDAVLASLSELVNFPAPNITKQFQKYDAAVNTLDAQAAEVRTNATAMQEQGAAYLQKWSEELAKIQNDDIQNRSMDRRNATTARFKEVKASYVETNAQFALFMSDLKDIRTLLATDLTVGGLDSIKGLSAKANEKALPLRESLVRLSDDFKSLGVALSTTSVAR